MLRVIPLVVLFALPAFAQKSEEEAGDVSEVDKDRTGPVDAPLEARLQGCRQSPQHGRLIGVIDLDSPHPGRFDAEDQAGIEQIAGIYQAASTV